MENYALRVRPLLDVNEVSLMMMMMMTSDDNNDIV